MSGRRICNFEAIERALLTLAGAVQLISRTFNNNV